MEDKNNENIETKSEMYNDDQEKIDNKEPNDAIMWGFVLGFMLFLIIVVMIIVFTN